MCPVRLADAGFVEALSGDLSECRVVEDVIHRDFKLDIRDWRGGRDLRVTFDELQAALRVLDPEAFEDQYAVEAVQGLVEGSPFFWIFTRVGEPEDRLFRMALFLIGSVKQ